MGEKVYGYHAIEEAIKKAGMGSTLFVERGGGEKLEALVRSAKLTGRIAVKKLSREELQRMLPDADVRGAILDIGGPRRGASRLKETSVSEFCASLEEGQGALVVLLDGITDPHNLGAILRSADQFGADLVVIPERRAVQANETVVKVSSGAAQYVPLAVVTNLSRVIDELKDVMQKNDRIVELRANVRKAAEAQLDNGVIDATDLLTKLTDEKQARLTASYHEIQFLQSIYQLKYTLNQ